VKNPNALHFESVCGVLRTLDWFVFWFGKSVILVTDSNLFCLYLFSLDLSFFVHSLSVFICDVPVLWVSGLCFSLFFVGILF